MPLRQCLTMPSRLGQAVRWVMIRVSVRVARWASGESPPRRVGMPASHFSERPRRRLAPGRSGLDASRRRADVPPPPRSPTLESAANPWSGPRRTAGSALRQFEEGPGGAPIGGGAALVPAVPHYLVIQAILYRPPGHPSRSRTVSRPRGTVFPRVDRGAAGPTGIRRRRSTTCGQTIAGRRNPPRTKGTVFERKIQVKTL
jgi:hypothetical protein